MARNPDTIVNVIGFPRCGSSMTMAMLAAGGMECVGDPPDFELFNAAHGWDLYPRFAGMGVKLLDMMLRHGPSPAVEQISILLARDPEQQLRSSISFGEARGVPPMDRAHRRLFKASLVKDMPKLIALARSRGEVLNLGFASILSHPLDAAAQIAGFVDMGLDVAAMAEIPRARSPLATGWEDGRSDKGTHYGRRKR